MNEFLIKKSFEMKGIIFRKYDIFYHFKTIICFIILSFSISSCKIFRSNKSVANNTHKHEKGITKSGIKTDQMIHMARTYIGVPYKSGGTTISGMDCSGLLFSVCNELGHKIPRISYQQAEIGEEVAIQNIRKGDFVFFKTSKNSNQISHVGMVTEVKQPQIITFIHSSTSKGVREDNLFSDYWKKAFSKATRPFVF